MNVSVPRNQLELNKVYNHADELAFEKLKKQFPEIPWTDNLFDDLWGKLSQRFTPKTKRYIRDCFFEHYTKELKE